MEYLLDVILRADRENEGKINNKKPTCYRALGGKLIRHFHLPSVPPRYLVSMSTVWEVFFLLFFLSSGLEFGPFTRHLDVRRADGTKASLLQRSITPIVYRRVGATCANCKKGRRRLRTCSKQSNWKRQLRTNSYAKNK